MSNVLHRITRKYTRSVNTPDYPVLDYIINHDLSAVSDFPNKYWKIAGDTVTLMSQSQRDTVDADLAAAQVIAEKEAAKAEYDNKRDLKALGLVILDEVNSLRNLHSLNPRTPAQFRTAFRKKVDD